MPAWAQPTSILSMESRYHCTIISVSVISVNFIMALLCFQIEAVEWPFEDNGNGNGTKNSGNASFQNIADYLCQRKICLMINLPMRLHRTTPAITKGYITRRLAVEYAIPLITDIKCAKLAVKVCTHHTAAAVFNYYRGRLVLLGI